MALATTDDVAARGGDICDLQRTEALLDDASAAVIVYTGQDFERSVRTKDVWPTNGCFDIVGRDVTAVSAVDANGNPAIVGQVGQYRWHAGTDRKIIVTYTAGWSEVPDDIVAVVCSMVLRAMSIDPASLGHSQDTAGPFSFTVGSASATGAIGLLPGEKAVLDRYRRAGRAVRAASWAGSTV